MQLIQATTSGNNKIRQIGSYIALAFLATFIFFASTTSETRFLDFVASLENYGTALAVAETLLTTGVAAAILWNIRNEQRKSIWIIGGLFTLIALAANLGDYFGTLQLSPDLDMEVSPIWNGLLKDTGMDFARLFGLCGKTFVSCMAGACLMFYLRNVQSLATNKKESLKTMLVHLGEKHNAPKHRFLQFATVLSFYFAAVNLFCFYVTYANAQVNNLAVLSQLPPLPAAVAIALAFITVVFVVVTDKLLYPNAK